MEKQIQDQKWWTEITQHALDMIKHNLLADVEVFFQLEGVVIEVLLQLLVRKVNTKLRAKCSRKIRYHGVKSSW